MYTIVDRQTGVDSIAIGPNELIKIVNGQLSKPIENLDLNQHFKNSNEIIEVKRMGPVLCFTQKSGHEDGEGILYNFEKQSVIFSSFDQPDKCYANFGDLTVIGYVSVSEVEGDNKQKLISIDDGTVTRGHERRDGWHSDCGKHFYERPFMEDRILKYDMNGELLWEVAAEKNLVNQRHGDPRPNRLQCQIGELDNQFWYQESSGVVKAVNIDSGELELKLGEAESDLYPGAIQREGEQLWGTFNYCIGEDNKRLFGMGGALYTEIDLTEESPRRRVYDCREIARTSGVSLTNCGPSYPIIDNKLIFCDSREAHIAAFDLNTKSIIWSVKILPEFERGSDLRIHTGIREFIANDDFLYVMVREDISDTSTLITLQREC